ncbi:MAG: chemotaxis protein CheA [Gammaproteobacteria bacterium]|nr:MAG: chemotaxis protein CheA [Gammaproteobacteria bacterium]
MSIDQDDEILQDFLVEAGEILESLGEQLVDLEQHGDDMDMLNSVFRGFHTIKGGAGFLNLTTMVDMVHQAEDIFNLLRNGERHVDANLMDVILPVLDVLNEQFDNLRAGEEPVAASEELLANLRALNKPESEDGATAEVAPATGSSGAEKADSGDITDDEFEALLDAAAAEKAGKKAASDQISDDEFEDLLDNLHGKGQFDASSADPDKTDNAAKSDEISDDEFETLLDELHGKGNTGKTSSAATDDNKTKSTQSAKAAPGSKPPTQAARPAAPASQAAPKPVAETTVRVDTRRLDDIMNMVGELVLVRNRLSTLQNIIANDEVNAAISNLDLVTSDLQMSVMKTRMQPVKKVFGRFPRLIRDLARSLNKEITLQMHGEDTDLDKNLVEALADPMVHLVRNAVDHGIESPEDREKAGKSRTGTVVLSAAQEGDHILLTIEDDGAGMDPDILRSKAIEKGLIDEEAAERMDDRDAYMLILAPGFSTKTEISDVSGRGVGMDVVKTKIVQLNGSVEIYSEKGKGSLISIKLPLTLAILPTLMIKLEEQAFALPLVNVNEIFNLDMSHINTVDGKLMVMVRDRPLPLFYLRKWLVNGRAPDYDETAGFVVISNIGNQKVGFVVDSLIGQEEVVIKPLGAMLYGTPGLAGATITGDGKIALILDVPSLLSAYAS